MGGVETGTRHPATGQGEREQQWDWRRQGEEEKKLTWSDLVPPCVLLCPKTSFDSLVLRR